MEERVTPIRAVPPRGNSQEVAANDEAMEATLQIRRLGEDLLRQVKRLDASRNVLKDNDIDFNPHFDKHTMAAVSVIRGTPIWDRQPAN